MLSRLTEAIRLPLSKTIRNSYTCLYQPASLQYQFARLRACFILGRHATSGLHCKLSILFFDPPGCQQSITDVPTSKRCSWLTLCVWSPDPSRDQTPLLWTPPPLPALSSPAAQPFGHELPRLRWSPQRTAGLFGAREQHHGSRFGCFRSLMLWQLSLPVHF